MARFIVRRLILLVPILLGLSLLVFLWIRALPASPAQSLLGERATPETIRQIEEQYGLDEPIHVQYWKYLKTARKGRPRYDDPDAPPGHRRAQGAVPGHD